MINSKALPSLTVGSLFSGIGGLDLGFEHAGFQIKWQVEIDGYCRKVLTKHWPDVPKYEDVRDVGAHNLERVDVIVGGFPCQDISTAGRGAGITGERSGLWREMARTVGELRPAYVVIENVPALIHRGLDTVLGDLTRHGYDASWGLVSAASVGAPHIRDRIFIVAYSHGSGSRGSHRDTLHKGRGASEGGQTSVQETTKRDYGSAISDIGPTGEILAHAAGINGKRHEPNSNREGHSTTAASSRRQELAHPHLTRLAQRQGIRSHAPAQRPTVERSDWWAVEPDICRVAHGVPNRVHRLRGLGNAVVPQVAEYVARRVLAHAQAIEQQLSLISATGVTSGLQDISSERSSLSDQRGVHDIPGRDAGRGDK